MVLDGVVVAPALLVVLVVPLPPSSSSKSDGVGGGPIVSFGSTISFETSNKSATLDRPRTINVASTRLKRTATGVEGVVVVLVPVEEVVPVPESPPPPPPPGLLLLYSLGGLSRHSFPACTDEVEGSGERPVWVSNTPDAVVDEGTPERPTKCGDTDLTPVTGVGDEETEVENEEDDGEEPNAAAPPPPPPPPPNCPKYNRMKDSMAYGNNPRSSGVPITPNCFISCVAPYTNTIAL